jgi:hypothetical protein
LVAKYEGDTVADQHQDIFPLAATRSSLPAAVGVPHRFGMNILLLLVTMFALLQAVLAMGFNQLDLHRIEAVLYQCGSKVFAGDAFRC